MNESVQSRALPELSLEEYAASGEELAKDLFVELHEGDAPADVVSRFSGYLADDVDGEPHFQNKVLLSGFIQGLLEWIPNLKTKPAPASSTAHQAGDSQVSPPHMSMKRLAGEIGMDRSACRRYVLKLGIEPVKRRTGDSGFQVALTVTGEQADKIKEIRAKEGYLAQKGKQEPPVEAAQSLKGFSNADLINEIRRRGQCGRQC
jgi:hypothetical protein